MATLLDKLTKHLNCAICLERIKEPKVLKCQHTYCRRCLEKLVEKSGQCVYVQCPECREKNEIPLRGVKDLPTNLLMNKLLSELVTPVCANHEAEIITLYCEACDQLICRECVITNHRGHKYKSVKDIYPAAKKKIEEVVAQSRKKIHVLETLLKTIDEQEGRAEINCKEISSKVDDVINQQIKLLQKKRESLKAELKELARAQKQYRDSHKKSFESSLNSMKQSVKFAEQTIKKGNELEVLSAKQQIIEKLTDVADLAMATAEVKPRGMILYDLKIDSPQDEEVLEKIPKIIEYDEEYFLKIRLCREDDWNPILRNRPKTADVVSIVNRERTFDIYSKSGHPTVTCRSINKCDVKVKVKQATSNDVISLDVQKNWSGSFSFSYLPIMSGNYEIDIMLNGRFVKGSPFKWEVVSL